MSHKKAAVAVPHERTVCATLGRDRRASASPSAACKVSSAARPRASASALSCARGAALTTARRDFHSRNTGASLARCKSTSAAPGAAS